MEPNIFHVRQKVLRIHGCAMLSGFHLLFRKFHSLQLILHYINPTHMGDFDTLPSFRRGAGAEQVAQHIEFIGYEE